MKRDCAGSERRRRKRRAGEHPHRTTIVHSTPLFCNSARNWGLSNTCISLYDTTPYRCGVCAGCEERHELACPCATVPLGHESKKENSDFHRQIAFKGAECNLQTGLMMVYYCYQVVCLLLERLTVSNCTVKRERRVERGRAPRRETPRMSLSGLWVLGSGIS